MDFDRFLCYKNENGIFFLMGLRYILFQLLLGRRKFPYRFFFLVKKMPF